jgi:triphosphatase
VLDSTILSQSVSRPSLTTGELALQVLRQHAAAFSAHASQAGGDNDPEHVHQTRVATRRMRAAIRLFGDVLPPAAAGLNDELRWIASQLGPLRDLDVQASRLEENATCLGLADALTPYAAWLEAERRRALTAIASAFASQRFQALSQQLAELDSWTPNPETDRPALEEGPQRLRRAYRRLRKKASSLDTDSPATEFHKARIRAKRLRYATEFFETLYGGPARRLVRRTVDLQDLLGAHQDGIVSNQRMREALQTAAEGWSAETALALGRVVQWEVERGTDLRRRFPATYREVKDAWKRLRRAL